MAHNVYPLHVLCVQVVHRFHVMTIPGVRELVHEAPTAGTYNRTTYFDRYEGIADLDAWRRAP